MMNVSSICFLLIVIVSCAKEAGVNPDINDTIETTITPSLTLPSDFTFNSNVHPSLPGV